MKRILFIFIIISALSSISCNAQFKKGSKEKIRTYKIAFLTEQLNLTEVEAEKFWPIYNVYDKKIMELRKKERFEIKKNIRKKGGLDKISEEEAKKIILSMEEITQQRYSLKNSFYKKVIPIISYKKLLKLEISEHEFNRKLLRKFRNKKQHYKK